jgi:hypothetical protein
MSITCWPTEPGASTITLKDQMSHGSITMTGAATAAQWSLLHRGTQQVAAAAEIFDGNAES